jgi:hypothetical protein
MFNVFVRPLGKKQRHWPHRKNTKGHLASRIGHTVLTPWSRPSGQAPALARLVAEAGRLVAVYIGSGETLINESLSELPTLISNKYDNKKTRHSQFYVALL